MEAEQIKEKLRHLIQLYENILSEMQRIEVGIGTASPAALIKFNKNMMEQHDTAAKIEHDLSILLSPSSNKLEDFRLLIEMREKLLKDIMVLNQRITTKAKGIRSFINHEMKRLHSGLSAMRGYKQAHHNQGRIVNSTL